MVSHQLIVRASENRWRWLAQCWRLRLEVADVAQALAQSPTQAEVAQLKSEIADTAQELAALREEHKLSRDGNRALLRFIHTGHRLNVKFDEGTIRAALQRAGEK
jgi:hypothetical protein